MAVKILAAAAAVLVLAGCSESEYVDYEQKHLEACNRMGGVYFEHEDTSAGDHWWCIGPDGADISIDGSGNEH